MRSYRGTVRARDDIRDIAIYTLRKWGKYQRNKYLQQLECRFSWLAEHPLLGRHRADIETDYYCYPQGEHLIFYRCRTDSIEIISVVHQEMDVLNYFTDVE
jgi:toxin ParE1/3/4